MTIYRCDKCKKEFTDISAIYRIRMMTETCEYDDVEPTITQKWKGYEDND